jgi:hypothetical protein
MFPELNTRIRGLGPDHPFWSRVGIAASDEDCWLWTGKLDRHGYGYEGRERCHRVAWELSRRESLRAGDVVRHTCDNPACCNPSHLIVGSQDENVADRVERERSARGSSNGRAVLSNQDAMSIYHAPGRRENIAARYGVSIHTVVDIKCGRTWGWLTGHSNSHRWNAGAGHVASAGGNR